MPGALGFMSGATASMAATEGMPLDHLVLLAGGLAFLGPMGL